MMFRRSSVLILGAVLLASSSGCRSTCNNNSGSGSGHGWFTANSRNSGAPCHLTSNNNNMMEGCFDPITGRPVPCPPPGTGVVIPGGTYQPPLTTPTRPDELPFPSPSDMIRPPGVPFAPPYPAPGTGTEGAGMTPKGGTTVKGTPNK